MGIIRKIVLMLCLMILFATPAYAQDYTAPAEPEHISDLLPKDRDSFGEGLMYVLKSGLSALQPSLVNCAGASLSLIGTAILITLVKAQEGKGKETVHLVGVIGIACLLLGPTKILIQTAVDVIGEISEYGKLLLPVMVAALSAQGGTVTSATLYTATVTFDAILVTLIRTILIPMVYIYLVLAVVQNAAGDSIMKRMQGMMKSIMTWTLKLILYIFTGFISITGVVSGTTDQTVLKAVKMSISSMVPVVGSMLSDASEAVIVSAGMVKNAVGISGMLVVLGIAVVPFFQIALQYCILKLTAAVCSVFADKAITNVIDDFTGAMGFLLGMTGTVCMIFLISLVCFLRGVG